MNENRNYPLGTLAIVCTVSLYLAYYFRQALVPFFLSFGLAYLVNPLINIFEARGFKREYVVSMLYIWIAFAISIGVNFLLPRITLELSLLQGQAPVYIAKTKEYWFRFESQIALHMPIGKNLVEHWSFQMYNPIVNYLQKLPSYLLDIFPLLSLIFLVPFISFYFLMDTSRLTQQAIQTCPSRYVEQALHLLSEIDTSLGNYVRGILIEAITIAVVSYIGMWALGLNYALAIATIAGFSSLVPYAGPVLGAAAGGLIALVQFHLFWPVAKVVLLFLAIRGADDVFLQPLISKHSIHLHPLIYLLALMVGAEAFGFVGLMFAVPAACIIKALLRVAWDWHVTESRWKPPGYAQALRIPYL